MKIGAPEKFLGTYDLKTRERLGLGKYIRRLERHYYRMLEDEDTDADSKCMGYQMMLSVAEMIEKHRRVQIAALVISSIIQLMGLAVFIAVSLR